MQHGLTAKQACTRCIVPGENIFKGEMAGEKSVVDTKIIRIRFPEIPRCNTGSVEDANEVAHEEEGKCGQDLFVNSSL